jgi:acyl dehydratase
MPEIDGHEVLGLGLYFEDLPIGRKFRTIGRTLTEADLVNFIGVTGMTEVLFSNTEFLRTESDIKQRVVPGAMVYAFAEGLLVHATMQHTGFAFLETELKILAPTFAGDTIHVECEVVENRRSASRPSRGLVRTFNRVSRQDGTVVLTYNPLRMVKARSTPEDRPVISV